MDEHSSYDHCNYDSTAFFEFVRCNRMLMDVNDVSALHLLNPTVQREKFIVRVSEETRGIVPSGRLIAREPIYILSLSSILNYCQCAHVQP